MTVSLGAYGVLSLVCNCLASHGVKTWKKVFLMPYLVFYPMVVITLTISVILSVLTSGVAVLTFLLPIGCSLLFTLVWLRLVRFWFLMSTIVSGGGGRRDDVQWIEVNMERSVRLSRSPEPDHPPAYDSPPGYQEAVSAQK